jgi:hypothetical protein
MGQNTPSRFPQGAKKPGLVGCFAGGALTLGPV